MKQVLILLLVAAASLTTSYAQTEVLTGVSVTPSRTGRSTFTVNTDGSITTSVRAAGGTTTATLGLSSFTQSAADARYPQLNTVYTNPAFVGSLVFSKLSGLPTTRAGYGITDAEGTIAAGTTAQYFRGDKTFQTLNTTAVAEGSNLYYTDARARASESATAPLVYNQATGVTSMPVATNAQDGYLSATDRTLFNSKQSPQTTLAGYGITDAKNYTPVATYAAMNALNLTNGSSILVQVAADEQYAQTYTWYMVWADAGGTHAQKFNLLPAEK